MKIKTAIAGILLCLMLTRAFAADTNSLAIIPWPQKVTLEAGAFKLTPDTIVYVDSTSRETGKFLTERLRHSTGYPLSTRMKFLSRNASPGGTLLTTRNANNNMFAEDYELVVASD